MHRRCLGSFALAALATFSACSSDADDGSASGGLPPGPSPAAPAPAVGAALTRVPPPWDIGSTAATIDAWPRIVPGIDARAITSFDRGGGNDDGFGGTYSELYADPKTGEHVVFDEWGPGVLRTLWLTSAVDGNSPLGLGTMRFYFDDEEKARIEVDADALFTGKSAPFVTPLVCGNQVSSGGFASWTPLAYRGRLRVTTAKKVGFYQAHYETLPPDWDVASWTPGSLDTALAKRFDDASAPSALALEEVPLDTQKAGSGVIDVVRFVPDAVPSDSELAAARVTISFEGADAPRIDVPLAFFFGSGFGLAPVRSIAWTITTAPVLFESRMPMPYWNGARVRVTGLAGKLFVHVADNPYPQAEAGSLEAIVHDARPTGDGDHVYADVKGAGKIVATVLGIDPITAGNKGWWEGDLRTLVDGVRTPAIHGTGHEDDHLGGWSNEFLSRPFTLPMQGSPRTELTDDRPAFQVNGRTSLYRIWPGIPFESEIRHSTEHGPSNARSANYASVTFLYRRTAPRLARTDAFDVADGAAAASHGLEGAHDTATVTSAFEGPSAETSTMSVHTYRAGTRFRVAIDPENDGVRLRRWFDKSDGGATAALLVDGVRVATLSHRGPVAQSRRWAEENVFVPAQLTRGKSTLAIEYVADRPLSAARFEAHSVVHAR